MKSLAFHVTAIVTSLLIASSLSARELPRAASNTTTPPPPLFGWVDMHTHPMAHLGFGGKLIHGAPDLNILMSAIPFEEGCLQYVRPTTREAASNEDRAIHGGFGLFDNTCGDLIRKEFIRGLESELGARVGHQEEGARGYPVYNSFPAYNDLTHQQMWVDWLFRTYQGGLRVMVALAVNNRTLAAAVMGPGDINGDDAASTNVQIAEMKTLVSQHSWMEIAYDSEDVRRIVSAGRLAIILGVEVDNIGNMQGNPAVNPSADDVSKNIIRAELQNLWDKGVRYMFPIHVIDNKFGGTAIYQDQFNMSNYHQNGVFWDLRCAPDSDGIEHEFVVAGFDLAYALIKLKIGINPLATPPPPPDCSAAGVSGHANTKDLTPLGEFAVEEMMRMGMLLDLDHMSSRSIQETLAIAESHNYPVNAGHNGPRAAAWADKNENERTDAHYTRISNLGGMIGLGSGDRATNYVRNYNYVTGLVNDNQLAIGTDANGMVLLPGPDPAATVTYDASFPRLSDGARTWDIHVDGVANYGLFADYVKSWTSVGMTPANNTAFFSTAEGFARMWERVEAAQAAMIPTPPVANAGGPYSVNEAASVTLDASATTDINQEANTLTYEWDFDGDGAYDDATGSAPTFAAGDGPATVSATLRVTDSDSMTHTATATISVANVAPTATLVQLPPTMVFQGLSASFQFTSVTDVSSADVAAGFQYAVDCTNDGVDDVAWSSSQTATCTYPDAGTFTVRGHVRDKDGGIGDATTSVTILGPLQAMDAIAAMIEALRAAGSLNGGQANALLVKLNHARDMYTRGRTAQAVRSLEVLRNQVVEFAATGVLTTAESTELAYWIQQLMSSIAAGS